jgi:hypothetical protein
MAGSQVRQVWVTNVTLPSPLAVVYRSLWCIRNATASTVQLW